MEIKEQNPADLTHLENNSRTHSDQQITEIAASITEFGFTNPVLVDANNIIIAGHGRTSAAIELGFDKIPTIELKGLTDTQIKAYVIADNQLALNAGWDFDQLEIEISELRELDFDIDILGFDDGQFGDQVNAKFNNSELEVDDYEDTIELTFKLDLEKYHAAQEALRAIDQNLEIASIKLLGI